MSSIHKAASTGYATAAQTYVTGRPDYPPQCDTWLRETVELGHGKTVLDLGAGTGKFLPYLRRTGARVLAVEPVDQMRARIAQENPDVQALAGTASAIPLPDAALDAVVCAQSFHWFATTEAVAEIRRVLAPSGVLGLIWNVRDETVPWVAALSALTDPLEGGAPRYRTGQWRRALVTDGLSFLGEQHARNTHVGTPEQVIVDRTLSVSFIAALPADGKADVMRRVRALIAATPELARAQEVAFPYDTAMFAYRKLGG